jgi:hypothetical protein
MKKLCTLLALVLLLSCMPMSGCTAEPEPNPATDFEYEIGEDGTVAIERYIGESAEVVIPKEIDGKSVTIIGPAAFEGCTRVTSVILPDTLKHIGGYAFAKCTNLKKIHIPTDCLVDSFSTFQSSGLEEVMFADQVTVIPMGCFEDTKLTKVVCPPSLISIDHAAFHLCKELTEITLNQGLTTIGSDAFASTAITEIIIPDTVQIITNASLSINTQKVYFEGNAPKNFMMVDPSIEEYPFTIYYHEGAEGFTSPEWNGYSTEIW